jgi:polyhydroxyalkanoate synthesis repressor PhaR
VNLEDLERMVREDVDFRVVDASTGEDLTRRILAQVILEQMNEYEVMLPAEFLRFLIRHRGTTATWQDLVRSFGGGLAGPWADLFSMFGGGKAPAGAREPPPPVDEDKSELRDELDVLKQRLSEIEQRLGK